MNHRSISCLLFALSLTPALCADEASESLKKELEQSPELVPPKELGEEGQAASGKPEAKGEGLEIELNLKDLKGAPGDPDAKGEGLKIERNLKDLKGPRGKEEKGEKDLKLKILGSATFKMQDQKGSVETKNIDGGKEVTVRDKQGEVLFDGPWDTPQDKAAAPPEIRERIEKLDIGNRINLQFKTVPGPKKDDPEKKDEPEEKKVPEKKGGDNKAQVGGLGCWRAKSRGGLKVREKDSIDHNGILAPLQVAASRSTITQGCVREFLPHSPSFGGHALTLGSVVSALQAGESLASQRTNEKVQISKRVSTEQHSGLSTFPLRSSPFLISGHLLCRWDRHEVMVQHVGCPDGFFDGLSDAGIGLIQRGAICRIAAQVREAEFIVHSVLLEAEEDPGA